MIINRIINHYQLLLLIYKWPTRETVNETESLFSSRLWYMVLLEWIEVFESCCMSLPLASQESLDLRMLVLEWLSVVWEMIFSFKTLSEEWNYLWKSVHENFQINFKTKAYEKCWLLSLPFYKLPTRVVFHIQNI